MKTLLALIITALIVLVGCKQKSTDGVKLIGERELILRFMAACSKNGVGTVTNIAVLEDSAVCVSGTSGTCWLYANKK